MARSSVFMGSISLGALVILCLLPAALAARQISFSEVSGPRGIGETDGDKTSGPSVGDLDQNGYTDIVMCNHVRDPFEVFYGTAGPYRRTTFFSEMQDRHGTAIGDYDGDGDLDIVLAIGGTRGVRPATPVIGRTNFAGNLQRRESTQVGLGARPMRGVGPRFVDIDNDGDLDLFVQSRAPLGGGPAHAVYENVGGRFRLRPSTGLENGKVGGFCVFDYNGDGFADIVLLGQGIQIWKGNGQFQFTQVTRSVLANRSRTDNQLYGGAAALDYDNDGDLDLYLGGGLRLKGLAERREGDDILLENRDGRFFDVSGAAGIPRGGVSMGVTFADFNNDGFLDIFVPRSGRTERRINDMLLINEGVLGQKRFTRSLTHGANGAKDETFGVGAAVLDIDRDGRMDVVVGARRNPSSGRMRLYSNNSGNVGRFLTMVLPTKNAQNESTMDAKVEIRASGMTITRRVGAQGEFRQQSFDQNVHIGMNQLRTLGRITLTLTTGRRYIFRGPHSPGRKVFNLN